MMASNQGKPDPVKMGPHADGIRDELRELVGKRVKEIINHEYSIELIFEKGLSLEVRGSTYGDCALSVVVDHDG